jgi:tetratricopeptide (TPR) repeat protein
MAPKIVAGILLIAFSSLLTAQSSTQAPPEGESSSKDTQIDLAPPPGDRVQHPDSTMPDDDTTEMQLWDPHKALKHIEVGDFYFKRGNYRAAQSRYRDALKWKSNDALATYRLAESLEKLQEWSEARKYYETYLKILPNGELAQQAKDAIERLSKLGNSEAKK